MHFTQAAKIGQFLFLVVFTNNFCAFFSEYDDCHQGVEPFVDKVAASLSLKPLFRLPSRTIFFGFFWAISTRLVRTNFQKFIDAIDATRNVFAKRFRQKIIGKLFFDKSEKDGILKTFCRPFLVI